MYFKTLFYVARFFVNGRPQTVSSSDLNPDLSLAHFLRKKLHLTGTKVACGEGACGSCTVTLSRCNPGEDK